MPTSLCLSGRPAEVLKRPRRLRKPFARALSIAPAALDFGPTARESGKPGAAPTRIRPTGPSRFRASAISVPGCSSWAWRLGRTAPTAQGVRSPAMDQAILCTRFSTASGSPPRPHAVASDDGLKLHDAWVGSVVRCAPPGDKPTPEEIRNCASHLTSELGTLKRLRVVVCLGKIAWDGYLAHLVGTSEIARRSAYPFRHGAEYPLPGGLWLLASYHPSLRNTNTGRLNGTMFARVFARARELAGL